MCGIVGAVSKRNIVSILVQGLQRLEYRGYDSCGVAVHAASLGATTGGLQRARSTARVSELVEQVARRHAQAQALQRRGSRHTRRLPTGRQHRVVLNPRVGHARAERAHVIELAAERDDTRCGNLSPSRLQPDDAAHGGGDANGAAGVGADGAE